MPCGSPESTPVLADVLGPQLTARILADPAWPGLVVAVENASDAGWSAETVLSTAYELLLDGQDHAPVAGHELATALTWRTAMLAEANALAHTTGGSRQAAGPAPEPPDLLSPEDLLTGTDDNGSTPPTDRDDREPEELLSIEDEQWLDSVDWDTGPVVEEDHDPGSVLTLDTTRAETSDRPVSTSAAVDTTTPADGTAQQNPPTHGVTPARIADLNSKALVFFTHHYRDAWAADYLTERLGSDLVDDERFHPGYAPAGWTNLTDHLRAGGATDEELLAAGLATEAKTGRLIDRFRDRLVLPIYNGEQVHGFVGRRNPATDDAGPKYLNTADTALFTKGDQLYGATEGAAALASGATPVILEGPIDAIAVTVAGEGRYVGLAPLGTAFTDTQADSIATAADSPQPLVATDGDKAGRKAAERAYWLLTERGHNPDHTPMPAGLDPAQVLQQHGSEALRGLLDSHHPLAATLIDARINAHHDRLDTPEGTVAAGRAAVQVIAALPPQSWQQHLEHVIDRITPTPGWLHLEVFEAGQQWSKDPHAATRNRLSSRDYSDHHTPAPTLPHPAPPAARTPGAWDDLARAAHPGLLDDPGWPQLAAAMHRAQADGYDVAAHLPELVEQGPLPDVHPAQVLRYRLINESAAAITPVSGATRQNAERAEALEAVQRLSRPVTAPPNTAPPTPLDPALRADRAASDAARARLDAAPNLEQRVDAPARTQPAANPPTSHPGQPEPVAPPATPDHPQDPKAPRR